MTVNLQHNVVECQHINLFDGTTKNCNYLTMTQGNRLRQAREKFGYSQKELAEKVGISQQSLQKIETDNTKNPRRLQEIESILGLPQGYIKYGKKKTIGLPQPMIARCPLLDWQKAVWWPANKDEVMERADSLAQKIILSHDAYALKIQNKAMLSDKETTFKEGSYIIVDPTISYQPNNLVIAIEEESLIFRQYVKDGKYEHLFAFNREFKTITLSSAIKIVGVVVAHLDVLI